MDTGIPIETDRPTHAEIRLGALRRNFRKARELAGPGVKVLAVVKANAYGHGILRVAREFVAEGADYLGVAVLEEGVYLRENGVEAPILVLGPASTAQIPSFIEHRLDLTLPSVEKARAISAAAVAAGKTARVHLKIDTGMGRIGCTVDEAVVLARQITREKHLILEGTATHLSVADSLDPADRAYTRRQLDGFEKALASMRAEKIDPGIVHAANSGAVVLYPEASYNMVRPGILVYGYAPSPELEGRIPVKPVMELETQVVSIKKITAGTAVSYGRIWTASEDTFIATIPVGYADGLNRQLSPGLRVRIGGETFPVVGRICMDQCMIDIGADPWVQRWDHATIFGPAPSAVSAQTLADQLGTIPYEITCAINKRVPRVYTGEEAREL